MDEITIWNNLVIQEDFIRSHVLSPFCHPNTLKKHLGENAPNFRTGASPCFRSQMHTLEETRQMSFHLLDLEREVEGWYLRRKKP